MKKLIIPFIVILITGLIVINYFSFKSPKNDKIITQSTIYSLYETNELNIFIYANRKTAYQSVQAITSAYISDIDQSKKLKVELNKITKTNSFKYLEETFGCYLYNFTVPKLTTYFYIEQAYLILKLSNNDQLILTLGTFDYYVETDLLTLKELSGTRYSDFPCLKTITFSFDTDQDIYISRIHLANNLYEVVNKELAAGQTLTIELNKLLYKADQLAIKIVYYIEDELYEAVLPYYLYYSSNENFLIYGSINNVEIIN